MVSAYEQKGENRLRRYDCDSAFNGAIMCLQSLLYAFDFAIVRLHDR